MLYFTAIALNQNIESKEKGEVTRVASPYHQGASTMQTIPA